MVVAIQKIMRGRSGPRVLEPVQDFDQGMQRKAKVDDNTQFAGICECFEPAFDTAMRFSARS